MSNIAKAVTSRKTTKAFDSTKTLTEAQIVEIETLLRFSPSSTNSQPWHFVLAKTPEGKKKLTHATQGHFSFNESKILCSSMVVVFCTRASIDESYLQTLIQQEWQDGRFPTEDAKNKNHQARTFFVNAHRFERRDAQHWMEKQVYLSLGTLLLGAELMGINACPIEGFDQKVLDETLGLAQQGFTSAVMVALGYRSVEDFNANLPKSRLPATTLFTSI